jgi:hypothetical protein
MNIKRIAAIGAVAIGLAGSGLVFSEALSNPASPDPVPLDNRTPDAIDRVPDAARPVDNRTPDAIDRVPDAVPPVDNRTPDAIDRVPDAAAPDPVPASSSTLSLEAAVAKAADKAGLVMMCQRGLLDPKAESTYVATVAAHPDLAADIGPDCRILTFAP